MQELRGALRSKTIWLGLLVVVSGFFQANLPLFKVVLASFVAPEHLEMIFAAYQMMLGLLIVVVRFFTSESLALKGQS